MVQAGTTVPDTPKVVVAVAAQPEAAAQSNNKR